MRDGILSTEILEYISYQDFEKLVSGSFESDEIKFKEIEYDFGE